MARTTPQMFWPLVGTSGRRGAGFIFGSFTLGASGAIASADGFFPSAAAGVFGVVKTAGKTARYTFTMDRKYRKLRVLSVTLTGPTDAGLTTATANDAMARNVSGNGFDIQLMIGLNAGGSTDTDGMSGLVVNYLVQVERFGGPS